MLLESGEITRAIGTGVVRDGDRRYRRSMANLIDRHAQQIVGVLFFFTRFDPLAQFRIVNNYGLFAVMTRERYEIEFQGTRDGKAWIAYPFRFKPQDPRLAPGIYAPYQPRFDWNLWFASFGTVPANPWVMTVQERLLANEPEVLQLFGGNPFASAPPHAVRTVRWQFWFTNREERARTGNWWNRRFVGEYSPLQMKTAR